MLNLKKKNNRYDWIFLSKRECASDKEKIELLIKNFCSECEIVKSYDELINIKSDFDYYYNDFYNRGLIDDIDDISYIRTISFYLKTNLNRVLRRSNSYVYLPFTFFDYFILFIILFIFFGFFLYI